MTPGERIAALEKKLKHKADYYYWQSYVARRITILGGLYVALFLPVLLIRQYWKLETDVAQKQVLIDSLHALLAPNLQLAVLQTLMTVVVLYFCAHKTSGPESREGLANFVLALVTIPVFWMLADTSAATIVRACHGLMLLVGGLLMNRTFGYSKSWARKRYYMDRLDELKGRHLGGEDIKSDFDKLHEAYCADTHREMVGDTFFILDQAAAKLQGK